MITIVGATPEQTAEIEAVLARFPEAVPAAVERAGIRIIVLRDGQTFEDVAPALKRCGANISAWPIPPAGLYVIEDRALVLRSVSPMTLAHEIGHAYDAALGNGEVYRSNLEPRIRLSFAKATAFVTPYAASALDEYFAECLRAYVGVNDDAARSVWPAATRERLRVVAPEMERVFDELIATGDLR